ncbi:TPA: hypothetical protein ACXNR3_006348, partial [Pseudomonas aeruginosa]
IALGGRSCSAVFVSHARAKTHEQRIDALKFSHLASSGAHKYSKSWLKGYGSCRPSDFSTMIRNYAKRRAS